MMTKLSKTYVGKCLLMLGCALAARAQADLQQDFMNPPDEAKPRVWWHWMNGNVTKEGITADLEWMKRVGIGGFQIFDGSLGTPQFVENRLVWMEPQWKEAMRHAAAEAERLGLEMAVAASGGWSQTGGPWVEPAAAMKKVVWSEMELTGPRHFSGTLASPPTSPGVFQDIPSPHSDEFSAQAFYSDIKVLAWQTPEAAVAFEATRPKITSSVPGLALAHLMDDRLDQTVSFPFKEGEQRHWIQFEFDRALPAREFTLMAGQQVPHGTLESSLNGRDWTPLLRFGDGGLLRGQMSSHSFPAARARYFRLVLERPAPSPFAAFEQTPDYPIIQLAEVELSATPRVHRWHEKAQFASMQEFGETVPPQRWLKKT